MDNTTKIGQNQMSKSRIESINLNITKIIESEFRQVVEGKTERLVITLVRNELLQDLKQELHLLQQLDASGDPLNQKNIANLMRSINQIPATFFDIYIFDLMEASYQSLNNKDTQFLEVFYSYFSKDFMQKIKNNKLEFSNECQPCFAQLIALIIVKCIVFARSSEVILFLLQFSNEMQSSSFPARSLRSQISLTLGEICLYVMLQLDKKHLFFLNALPSLLKYISVCLRKLQNRKTHTPKNDKNLQFERHFIDFMQRVVSSLTKMKEISGVAASIPLLSISQTINEQNGFITPDSIQALKHQIVCFLLDLYGGCQECILQSSSLSTNGGVGIFEEEGLLATFTESVHKAILLLHPNEWDILKINSEQILYQNYKAQDKWQKEHALQEEYSIEHVFNVKSVVHFLCEGLCGKSGQIFDRIYSQENKLKCILPILFQILKPTINKQQHISINLKKKVVLLAVQTFADFAANLQTQNLQSQQLFKNLNFLNVPLDLVVLEILDFAGGQQFEDQQKDLFIDFYNHVLHLFTQKSQIRLLKNMLLNCHNNELCAFILNQIKTQIQKQIRNFIGSNSDISIQNKNLAEQSLLINYDNFDRLILHTISKCINNENETANNILQCCEILSNAFNCIYFVLLFIKNNDEKCNKIEPSNVLSQISKNKILAFTHKSINLLKDKINYEINVLKAQANTHQTQQHENQLFLLSFLLDSIINLEMK